MAQMPHADLEKWKEVSKIHFSTITPHYDEGRAFENGQPWIDEISRHTPVHENDWVLDVGTGTGLFAAFFAREMAGQVLGMDPSRTMLQHARRRERPANLYWSQGAAEALPLADASLQVVFLSQVWHHLKDQERAGREFFRCLKPGGGLFIKTFGQEQLRTRWDLETIFPELLPLMLSIYPALPDLTALLEKIGFASVISKTIYKEDCMRPSKMLTLLHQKAWSMFSFLSGEGVVKGETHLKALVEAGDLPVSYPEAHLLVIARR
jgi:ubiquinone/menaquinone biosynthesis C-methylase UbiE